MGSWLQGPGRPADAGYPGERLGCPEAGPGSVARLGPRFGALFIDYALASLIAYGLLGYRPGGGPGEGFKALAVFAVMHWVMVGTGGYTIGHRLVGMRVVRLGGGYAGPLAALIRTVLLALGIPALIADRDQRGLHDKAAGTVLIRT